jgi:hypothetical protein
MKDRLFGRLPVATAAGCLLLVFVLGAPRHAWAQG